MRRTAYAVATALSSALFLASAEPQTASAAQIYPGDHPRFTVPRPVPPSIGFRIGHGYRHAEQWPLDCSVRAHGVPTTVKLTTRTLSGGLSLSFFSTGDPDVKSFRVSALSETLHLGPNPKPVWKTVTVPKGCRLVTATVNGLKKGDTYTVWVDAIMVRRLGAPGTLDRTVGRMGSVPAG